MTGGFWAKWTRRRPVVSVLRLSGPIGDAGALSRGLRDATLAARIERAFQPKRLAAVALAINSPGGAPAQSNLIAQRIRDHAAEKKVPVIAFCEDVAASGGYMLACAADEIFVDDYSVVGSIGVVSASFGLHEAIGKLGVERRVITAGENKVRLDPFSPEKADDVAWLQALQLKIHAEFIDFVRRSRGARLGDAPPADLFSGEVYVGRDAVALGLADGIARLRPEMRRRFGDEVVFNKVEAKRGLLERFGAGRAETEIGAGLGSELAEAAMASTLREIEAVALRARVGL